MLLVCNNRQAALEVLGWLKERRHSGSERIAKMRGGRVAAPEPAQLASARALAERLQG